MSAVPPPQKVVMHRGLPGEYHTDDGYRVQRRSRGRGWRITHPGEDWSGSWEPTLRLARVRIARERARAAE